MTFEGYFTETFNKKIKKLDGSVKGKVKKQIDNILKDPHHNTFFLNNQFRGKKKKRVGDIRIIFTVCIECREKAHTSHNGCMECEGKSDDAIIFFDVDFRGAIYN